LDKIKLLYIGDLSNTGFGTVSVGFLGPLYLSGKYDILHMGINYHDLMPPPVPWKLVSAGFWHQSGKGWIADDPYGYMKVQRYIEWFDPDIVMLNNDFPIADKFWQDEEGNPTNFAQHHSKKVLYAPLDSQPCPPFFASSAQKWDLVLMYSHWQKKMMVTADEFYKDNPVIYHGIDPNVFFPMDKKEAKTKLREIMLRSNPDAKLPDFTKRYIVYFNGTNQFRKDLPTLFRGFAEFRKKVKNALLIPHSNMVPSEGGWYLPNLAGLTGVEDVLLLNNAHVFKREEVNVFYNAADVMAYTTRGEGFGLPSFEAMATKTPVIATRFGPQIELHQNGRGYFIKVKELMPGINHAWTYFALPDYEDLARQLYHVYANPDEAAKVAERAYNWVQQFSWENQATQLDGILMKLIGEQRAAAPTEETVRPESVHEPASHLSQV
jgi:glycosyltransferase involved in cell wall biosynthesis